MEDIPKELQEDFASFQESLETLEKSLQPLLALPLDQLVEPLNDIDSGRLYMLLAYAMNSLFYVYLRTQGVDPEEHQVKEELARVQKYIQKLKKLEEKRSNKRASMQLNVEAAQRFIKHGLSGNDKPADSNSGETNQKEQEEGEAPKEKSKKDTSKTKSKKKEDNNKKRKPKNKGSTAKRQKK